MIPVRGSDLLFSQSFIYGILSNLPPWHSVTWMPTSTLVLDVSLFCYQHTDTSYEYHHPHHLCYYACQSVQHDQRYGERDCSGMTRAERVLHDYYLCFFLFPASEEREKELLVSLWEKFQQ